MAEIADAASHAHRPVSHRFWAFLSYASEDAAVAGALHRRIERYRLPGSVRRRYKLPLRLRPICRDRDDLPASPDLRHAINESLEQSRFLIVLCSPSAAQSRWVNEEISYFKSLGRGDRILAVIIDGEPNASASPDGAARECFPPALRHTVGPDGQVTDTLAEPLAADLRRGGDGWRNVLLKTIAGMARIGADALIRRDRARNRRRIAIMAVSAATVIAFSLWAWDYNRLKVANYAAVCNRWSVPVGIRRLPAGGRGRHLYFQIESRQGKVRRLLRLNGSGSLANTDDGGIAMFHYRENGSLRQIDYRDHNDRLLKREMYSDPGESEDGRTVYLEFHQEYQDALAAQSAAISPLQVTDRSSSVKTDIVANRIRYDEHGRIIEVLYYNGYRQPHGDANGVFGNGYVYNRDGLWPVRVDNLGFDGRPHADRLGLVSMLAQFDSRGNATNLQYVGIDDRPITNTGNCSRLQASYDSFDNSIEFACFDSEGRPIISTDGEHRTRQTFDTRGNLIQVEWFGTRGEPVLTKERCQKTTITYDAHGYAISDAIFGVDGKPVYGLRGAPRITQTVDERGNARTVSYFDGDGRPILVREGYHRREITYDDHGDIRAIVYFDNEGKPVLNRDGYHLETQTFDERRQLRERAYFGVDRQPILNKELVHKMRWAYDERGNTIEEASFGTTGQPTRRGGTNYHRWTHTFDARGNLITEAFFDLHGALIIDQNNGYARYEQTVDGHGNVTEGAYFDAWGRPRSTNYFKWAQRFDNRGNIIEIAYFGSNGEPYVFADGTQRITRKFDSLNRMIEVSCFGKNGEPVREQAGDHRLTRTYDARGLLVEEAYFGLDDLPAPIKAGYQRQVQQYDGSGNLVSSAYFGADGQPARQADGWHRMTRSYDERGDLTSEAVFDVDDRPMLSKDGYHRWTSTMNAHGYEVARAFWGTDGKPTTAADGYHRVTRVYDPRGNQIEEAYFGVTGHPVAQRRGYHRETRTIGSADDVLMHHYFDVNGAPTVNVESSRVATTLFDHCSLSKDKNLGLEIIVPVALPAQHVTVYADNGYLTFVDGSTIIADVRYEADSLYTELSTSKRAMLIEMPYGTGSGRVMPDTPVRRGAPPGLPKH